MLPGVHSRGQTSPTLRATVSPEALRANRVPLIMSADLPPERVPSRKPPVTAAEALARFAGEQHEAFMRRAIANARRAGLIEKSGGAFGAVVVDASGAVLGDGWNQVIARNDPTWHGEMHAIREACQRLASPKLHGCILYTSAAPCPMCLATAYWAHLDAVISASTVLDAKLHGNFDDSFIYAQFAIRPEERPIAEIHEFLRPEAIEVWREYASRTDAVEY
jgi:guanine deaminase